MTEMVASLSGKCSMHSKPEGGGSLPPLDADCPMPGEDGQAVCLSDRRSLKRRDEFSGSLQARQKSRSSSSGPYKERRQRSSEILRAALDLVSDLETSDSADETSSGGTLSARSASSADFARVMGMLESSSDDNDQYHDRYCAPDVLSPVQPDCSESRW